MSTVALHNLWSYLQGLSLSQSDREWLANHLVIPTTIPKDANADAERLDEALAHFHTDWGGNADAMTIAKELRDSNIESRTVDVW